MLNKYIIYTVGNPNFYRLLFQAWDIVIHPKCKDVVQTNTRNRKQNKINWRIGINILKNKYIMLKNSNLLLMAANLHSMRSIGNCGT